MAALQRVAELKRDDRPDAAQVKARADLLARRGEMLDVISRLKARPPGGQPAEAAVVGVTQALASDRRKPAPSHRRFLRELSLDFPQVRDGTDAVARRWGATGIPETFFIDVRGRVVGHVIGTTTEAQLDAGVAAARSGTPRIIGSGGDQRPTR